MAYFKDAQEVYDTIGRLFVDLAQGNLESLKKRFIAEDYTGK